MKEEFNLSEKIVDEGLCIQDVKQFIKEILELVNTLLERYPLNESIKEGLEELEEIIKRKAGDKLK